jgi:RNA polymerase sigma-70 factor (ECF subfamily)
MPEERADNELVERYRRGDASAMEALLSRWAPRVRRLLVRLAGPRCDVEDLGQEVFLRVVRAAPAYRPQWAFSTLLYRIVLSVTRDAARRGRRRIRTTSDPDIDHRIAPSGGGAPGEEAQRGEAARLVAVALASLPDDLREPLILRHYGDLTFQQTADVLGLPASTVKSRVQAALVRLRGELRQRGLHDRETP